MLIVRPIAVRSGAVGFDGITTKFAALMPADAFILASPGVSIIHKSNSFSVSFSICAKRSFADVSSSDAHYVLFKSKLPIPAVPSAAVPEPTSMLLFGMGSGLLGFVSKSRKRN